jgi:hypothetical protein
MMLGRVDEVDGHFIATKFVAFAIPTECMYIPRVDPRSTFREDEGRIRIRRDWRSIGLGYARVWLPLLAVALFVAQAAVGNLSVITWFVSLSAIGIAIIAHASGRLPESEKARLRLLGTVTGLRLCPTKLNDGTREIKRQLLGELMEKGGIPTTAAGILQVLEEIPLPALPLVYGYVCYAGDTPEWRTCADLVYGRHERGEL